MTHVNIVNDPIPNPHVLQPCFERLLTNLTLASMTLKRTPTLLTMRSSSSVDVPLASVANPSRALKF
ncbi:hypothetical protein A2U01_0046119 [Trifolium medium]|uniref:Uncharacterized protein n=1 Tax=Trifolium medium TaxID=97028 RepID=A0A392QM51_9FABA|nr:hypothetical protein [Trifolium medium]